MGVWTTEVLDPAADVLLLWDDTFDLGETDLDGVTIGTESVLLLLLTFTEFDAGGGTTASGGMMS